MHACLSSLNVCSLSCFFFQAEDGIRDWSVTGVQTCALPISIGCGMVAAPHPMVAGMHERDYYQGKVTMATPEQRAWADAREAELARAAASADAPTATSTEASVR